MQSDEAFSKHKLQEHTCKELMKKFVSSAVMQPTVISCERFLTM